MSNHDAELLPEESSMSDDTADTASSEDKSWALPFFTIWIGQAFSLVGSRMGGFALVWWLTQASGGSATVLATASLVAMLPGVLLGPIVGALVDRWSRRRVMILADTLVAAFSAGLAILAWTGRLQVWHIYIIMFVRALGGTFHWAAMQASTSLMVPKSQLTRISGMNQTLQGALTIITPPLGALAMSIMPLQAIMGIDVVTAFFAVVPLFFVLIPDPATREEAVGVNPVAAVARDIRDGFRFVWRWPGLLYVLLIATLLNGTIGPGFALLPILVSKTFGKGVLELGWMQMVWGIGLIAGGLILGVWGGFKRKIVTILMGLVVAGISFTVLGLTPASAFGLALASVFMAGLLNPFVNGPFMAIVQSAVPPELQGRVFTVIGSVVGLASPIGMAIAGPVADRFGVQLWFVIGGILSIIMGAACVMVPAVLHLEDGRPERAPAVSTGSQ
jgi:MFS transporter, DHA3 family, macrolide efflux protein